MRLLFLLPSVLLAGCYPVDKTALKPQLDLPASYSVPTKAVAKTEDVKWWLAYNDSQLEHIVDYALHSNYSLEEMEARLKASHAHIGVAAASGFPSLTLGASSTVEREQGEMADGYGLVRTQAGQAKGFAPIDLFGEYRSQKASAVARRDATAAALDDMRLKILSAVMTSYVDMRYYQAQLRVARSAAAVGLQTVELAKMPREVGLGSDLEITRARNHYQEIRAAIPRYSAAMIKTANRIATLSGRLAGKEARWLLNKSGQPKPSWDGQAGVPAALLRLRPDIRQAEAELIEAHANLGVATAQLYPSLKLSGSITPSSIVTQNIGSGGLTSWSFGPVLTIPIFEGGRLRANVMVAKARIAEKRAKWKATVLAAVEDVEGALTDYQHEKKAVRTLTTRVAASRNEVRLTREQFDEGTVSLKDVLDAEASYWEAQKDLVTARRNLALYFASIKIAAGYIWLKPSEPELTASLSDKDTGVPLRSDQHLPRRKPVKRLFSALMDKRD
jgi:multidrug efflux system outer membrane protein